MTKEQRIIKTKVGVLEWPNSSAMSPRSVRSWALAETASMGSKNSMGRVVKPPSRKSPDRNRSRWPTCVRTCLDRGSGGSHLSRRLRGRGLFRSITEGLALLRAVDAANPDALRVGVV